MHPSIHARTNGDKAAVIMAGSGQVISYDQLDRRSNQIAQFLRAQGLGIGDTVALCLENRADYFDVVWGAQRAGLIFVAISNRLTADEIAYILGDSGSRLLFASDYLGSSMAAIREQAPGVTILNLDAAETNRAISAMPDTPIGDERAGADMLYSSGTTGRPKGIRLPLPEDGNIAASNSLVASGAGCVRLWRGQHLPVTCAAVSCSAFALVHDRPQAGRHRWWSWKSSIPNTLWR